jgi:DNA ligase-1
MENLRTLGRSLNEKYFFPVLPVTIHNLDEMDVFEQKCIDEGFEGIMIRSVNGPYKLGRSTENEGYLLKLKRFEDSEAEVLELVEKLRNDNEATKDNTGHTKRQTLQENMTPMNTLGAMVVKDVRTGVKFNIGSGFDDLLRETVWKDKANYVGKTIKYRHQPSGAKEAGAPRFPVFIGFRHPNDMD